MTTDGPKRTTANRPGCLVGFSIFWIAFSLVFLFVGLGDDSWVFAIFGGIFVAIGFGLLVYAVMGLITRYRMGKPIVTFSLPTLHVGDSFTMTYEHTLRQSLNVQSFTVDLIFREVATYQQGTDTRTVTHNHIIDSFEQPSGHYHSGHFWHETFEMTIPADGMHSLDVRRNKLKWIAKIQIKIPKLPDFVEEYELTVLPEMAR
ncbi:MAG: hypothetical protein DWQ04_12215 [Chloroflexi bacterium]|nr:MAG: hypothetical protein DWQ04_12215 [Chloroflexota bacterium]